MFSHLKNYILKYLHDKKISFDHDQLDDGYFSFFFVKIVIIWIHHETENLYLPYLYGVITLLSHSAGKQAFEV